MTKLTPAQNALTRRLVKAGPRGLNLTDAHDQTVTALLERGIAAVQGGRVVLIAPTRKTKRGITIVTEVDWAALAARTTSPSGDAA